MRFFIFPFDSSVDAAVGWSKYDSYIYRMVPQRIGSSIPGLQFPLLVNVHIQLLHVIAGIADVRNFN
jgi:hypothetical protein